jgi:DNA-binding winged helix-turn-helix (wHTH) protein
MEPGQRVGASFAFGDFVLDPSEAALTRHGDRVPVAPKEFELLTLLVSRAGHLVPKDVLVHHVWPDTFVSDGSLLRNISVLRRHLGYDAIRTVSKRGYVFALPVAKLGVHARQLRVSCQACTPIPQISGTVAISVNSTATSQRSVPGAASPSCNSTGASPRPAN